MLKTAYFISFIALYPFLLLLGAKIPVWPGTLRFIVSTQMLKNKTDVKASSAMNGILSESVFPTKSLLISTILEKLYIPSSRD